MFRAVAFFFVACYRTRTSHALTQGTPPPPKGAPPSAHNNRGSDAGGGDHRLGTSPFVGSRWKLRLDFGSEPGSFVPKRFPEWGASGARLGIPLELWFTDVPVVAKKSDLLPENVKSLLLCGGNNNNNKKKDLSVFRVEVSTTTVTNSTFVSERGEEAVSFVGGGYSMERSSSSIIKMSNNNIIAPNNNKTKSDDYDLGTTKTTTIPKPRFLLRFWIDCTSGAKRNDVELKPFSRIIGTIPVWDDRDQIAWLQEELAATKASIVATKEEEAQQSKEESKENNNFFSWLNFRKRKRNDDDDESSPEYRRAQLERLLPLKGSVATDDGVLTVAPKGSLVMPCYDEKAEESGSHICDNDVVGKHRYFIIGSFSMKCITSK